MGRAPCCEKVGIKRGRWTAEEDETLRKYIEANGEGSWRSLPKNAGLLRCGKSCRLRWINYLRSDLKRGNISAAEEDIIINLHATMGNRWSLIAAYLPGRTDNEIKNYWNSHLSRKIYSFRRLNPNFVPPPLPPDSTVEAKNRTGGKTARSATKKTKRNNSKSSPKKPILSEQITQDVINGGTTVQIPTTPTLEKEALTSCTIERHESNGGSTVTVDASPPEEGMGTEDLTVENRSLMLCLDDMMADLNDIWSMDEDRGLESGTIMDGEDVRACLGDGNGINNPGSSDYGELELIRSPNWEWYWGQEENTASFSLWDSEKDDRGLIEMEDEKQNAMVAWLLS